MPECLWLPLLLACSLSSVICTWLELRSWPLGHRNPSQRRHWQRVDIALALFPRAGNQLIFDQLLSRIADRPWRQSGIGCECLVRSFEGVVAVSIRMVAEGDIEQSCGRFESARHSTTEKPVRDLRERPNVHGTPDPISGSRPASGWNSHARCCRCESLLKAEVIDFWCGGHQRPFAGTPGASSSVACGLHLSMKACRSRSEIIVLDPTFVRANRPFDNHW